MSAREIAFALAGRRAQRLPDGGYLVCCPVPSHGRGRGDRNPSLRLADGDKRLLVRCYAGCDARDVLAELRKRGLIDIHTSVRFGVADSRKPPEPRSVDEYEREQHRKAAWLWLKCRPIAGTIAERYLRARRINCPLPPTLAFLPPYKAKHHPALIATFGIPTELEPGVLSKPDVTSANAAVHLTLLAADGSGKADVKPSKLIIGRPLGRPIVVAPFTDLGGLIITEGIEDALSAHQATGLAAWAAGSAGMMPALADAVPNWIESITICAHHDKAGQDGARKLVAQLHARGFEVCIEGMTS